MLKVYRPEGNRLVLIGTSPLVSLAPGETTTASCDIPVSKNDLIGCFCPDINCVDRLPEGAILAADGDRGTGLSDVFENQSGGLALFASTTRSFDVPTRAEKDLVIPVVGRGPGAAGTRWVTSLEVFNTGVEEALVALYFNRTEIDNTRPASSAQAVIPARGLLIVDDLLLETFDIEAAVGSVDLIASEAIIAHARIANQDEETGSYGQMVSGVPAAWGLGDDQAPGLEPNADIAYLFAVVENEEYRTNVGVCNLSGFDLEVDVSAFDETSPVGEDLRLSLPPFSHIQVNQVLEELEAETSSRPLRLNVTAVEGSSGRFLAYSSRIDNTTGDAVFQMADRQAPLPD